MNENARNLSIPASPEFATPKRPQPFIVFATPRTGSYHLTSLLNSAPDLACYGEIYKGGFVELPKELLSNLGLGRRDAEKRDQRKEQFVHDLEALSPGRGVGFKLFPAHVKSKPFLNNLIFSGRHRVVILSRPLIEIYISLQLAKMQKKFVRKEGTPETDEPFLTADAEGLGEVEKFVARFRNHCKEMRQAKDVPTFDIRYSEVVDGSRLNMLLKFLGSSASASDLVSDRVRQSNRKLHERVENWDWLVEHLRATDRLALLGEAGYKADGSPFA